MARNPNDAFKLLDRLLAEGRIALQQSEGAKAHIRRTGERVEEVLIEMQAMSEADLLKYIAGIYKTRFVSTDKLSRADISPATLARLPQKIAERIQVFPILFDARTQTLSIVTADLDGDVAKDVQMATGVREVKVYASRPAAVRAAIKKFYGGDKHAFGSFDRKGLGQFQQLLDVYERNLVDDHALKGGGTAPPATGRERVFSEEDFGSASSLPAAPVSRATSTLSGESAKGTISKPASDFPAQDVITSVHEIPSAMLGTFRHTQQPTPAYDVDPVALLHVVVSLLESQRSELRGHSSQVARLVGQLCEKMGLMEAEKRALLIAAHLHDLGKGSNYHLTALNVAEFEGHRAHAQKAHLAPLRLFEGVTLPRATTEALTHLYERFDGKGFPDQLAGKEIPLGARMLAIAETYIDITANEKNPYRKALSSEEACEVLAGLGGKVLDPNLVSVVVGLIQNHRAPGAMDGGGTVLIVDPDPEETTVLELRFFEAGHEVLIARSMSDAQKLVDTHEVDVVISEVDLEAGDGFELLQEFRARQQLNDVPVLFLTRRSDRESVNRGFGLGAADYLVKPTSVDVVVAKAQQLMEGRGRAVGNRGIAGSLREMGLPDVVQLLAQGRKSGRLRILAGTRTGEIHFVAGEVFAASFGTKRGEEAVYAMLTLKDGSFELDATFRPAQREIHASAESLLLEGMRRLDEGSR
ncbi:MAG: DUF4388 domain-containing protein [Sandaracinaceae bacterium]|nr:DUF4388 domain-containing protein [Sandaracinaceae bacterium]